MVNNNMNTRIALRQEIVKSYNNLNSDILDHFTTYDLGVHIHRTQRLLMRWGVNQMTLFEKS